MSETTLTAASAAHIGPGNALRMGGDDRKSSLGTTPATGRRPTVGPSAMSSRFDRLAAASPVRLDLALAVALLALAQLETWLGSATEGQRVETAVAAAAMTAALAIRRSHPLACLLAVMGAVMGLAFTAGLPNVAFLMPVGVLAVYSVGANAEGERAVLGLGLSLVAIASTAAQTDDASVTDLTVPAVMFSAAWALGRALRHRGARSAELERHAKRLESEQAEREAAAAAEERQRIARELHDIVAHRVSAIVIQAESGIAVADEPERTRQTFGAIGASGRQALDELRRLLGLLREGDEDAAMAPQPGLAGLDRLLDEARAAGLPVEARTEGEIGDLPPGVDVAAYRIVQEALTNALRHARTDTTVVVRREADVVALSISNPIPSHPPAGSDVGGGRGLAGMRERARIYGGTLEAFRDDGRFVVNARLPSRELAS